VVPTLTLFWNRAFCRFMLLLCFAVVLAAQGTQPPKPAPKDVSAQNQPTAPAPLPDGNAAVDKMNFEYIRVWRALMTPKNVADTFGRRIAKRYIAVQVTIANRNKDYQWLIQDTSMDLASMLHAAQAQGATCEGNVGLMLQSLQTIARLNPSYTPASVSSAELTVLRGVAEKGQALDPRNVVLRSLTGAGVIGAGLIGVATFGPSYAPAVAAFNGPLISAYKEIFPDYTVEQLNRLNDSAYLANTIVGKQQSKVLVMFLPQSYLLTKAQQKAYFGNPESVYACVDLRLLGAIVDGNFVTAVSATPVATSVTIDATEAAKFKDDNFTVNGTIIGNFFSDSSIDLVNPPKGLTVKLDGTPTDKQLKFVLTGTQPLVPNTALEFVIKSKSGDQAHIVYHVGTGVAPTLASIDPTTVKVGQSTTVTLAGTGFLPDGMTIVFDPSAGLTAGSITFTSSKSIKFDLAVAATAAEGQRKLQVSSAGGLSAQSLTFSVSK